MSLFNSLAGIGRPASKFVLRRFVAVAKRPRFDCLARCGKGMKALLHFAVCASSTSPMLLVVLRSGLQSFLITATDAAACVVSVALEEYSPIAFLFLVSLLLSFQGCEFLVVACVCLDVMCRPGKLRSRKCFSCGRRLASGR